MFGMWTFIKDVPRMVCTLTMTNSWTFLNQRSDRVTNYVGPSWTITTIASFYVMFPILLPQLQALSTPRLSTLIIILLYIQCMPLYFVDINDWYWPTTAHPLSRLPVFVIGMVAGLIRLRGKSWRWRVDFHFLI